MEGNIGCVFVEGLLLYMISRVVGWPIFGDVYIYCVLLQIQ